MLIYFKSNNYVWFGLETNLKSVHSFILVIRYFLSVKTLHSWFSSPFWNMECDSQNCDDAGKLCDALGVQYVADIEIEESKEPLEVWVDRNQVMKNQQMKFNADDESFEEIITKSCCIMVQLFFLRKVRNETDRKFVKRSRGTLPNRKLKILLENLKIVFKQYV